MTIGWRLLVVGVALLAACDRGADGPRAADAPSARRLDGSWIVRFSPERLRFEELTRAGSAARQVTASIALVANHWLDGNDILPNPTHYGSYDGDFRPLGFDLRESGRQPRAEAGLRGRDSVDVVLDPDEPERLRLQGWWVSDSIVGRWQLEADRVGGDAAGSFTMKRPAVH